MPLRVDAGARRIELSVGDLLPAFPADPFSPARGFIARMLAGLHAHRGWQADCESRDPGYRSEVVVRGELEVDGWSVRLEGRIDGLREEGACLVVEEAKSVVAPPEVFAAMTAEREPSWTFQLRCYLFLLAREGKDVRGRLVLLNLPGGERRELEVDFDLAAAEAEVRGRIRDAIAAAEEEEESLARRRERGARLQFPYPRRRRHQDEVEARMLEALDQGECLLVSAPPGLGKTAAALTAALRHALLHDRRVYFLTSKATQGRAVAATLARMVEAQPELRAVLLRAKAKICTNDVVFCHPEFCEFARDWPSKLLVHRPLERLAARGLVLPDAVREEALGCRACPFELELALGRQADVLVGDYNYVFDPVVALDAEGFGNRDRVLVIDEAHNLVERVRECWSPALGEGRVRDLLATVQVRPGEIYRALEDWLERLLRLLGALRGEAEEGGEGRIEDPATSRIAVRVAPRAAAVAAERQRLEELLVAYFAFRRDSGSVAPEDPVLDLAFEFLRFARAAEIEGPEMVQLVEAEPEGGTLWRVLCLDPAPRAGPILRSFHGVVAMSATLEPAGYYRDLLGFPPERTHALSVPSPFPRENRALIVAPIVQTTWRERGHWYAAIAATLRELLLAHPGHWAAFFPSFRFLAAVERELGPVEAECIVQSPQMSEAERGEVLERLLRADGTPRLLLAVLGGVFAEGVDLPGRALEGVVVVSPGLPQVSGDRELIRRYLDERHGRGFEYAYLVPGMNRVVQAAGRLLRGAEDRGAIVLLDRRFAEPACTRLFPRDWYRDSPAELVRRDPADAVREFFAGEHDQSIP